MGKNKLKRLWLWISYRVAKRGYNPDEPRVPAGNPDGGQWTREGGHENPAIKEPPLDSWYPIETILGLMFGWEEIQIAIEALGGEAAGEGIATAETGVTEHGLARAAQRGITNNEVEEAVLTAETSGNVETKIGKYGTPQKVYNGTNGVTVVKETAGRNAGKVITVWRHE